MNKQEVIEFLEKKRERALENIKYFANCGKNHEAMNRVRVDVYTTAIQAVEQIEEPQDEKVEVSQEFADWVENVKEDYGNWQSWCVKEVAGMGWGNWLHTKRNELDRLPQNGWVGEVLLDKEKYIKALYNGYTVKPKRWVVKYIPPFVDEFRYYSVDDEIFDITESSWTSDKEDAYPFTEKEKAEAVALLVEGSVEEID